MDIYMDVFKNNCNLQKNEKHNYIMSVINLWPFHSLTIFHLLSECKSE